MNCGAVSGTNSDGDLDLQEQKFVNFLAQFAWYSYYGCSDSDEYENPPENITQMRMRIPNIMKGVEECLAEIWDSHQAKEALYDAILLSWVCNKGIPSLFPSPPGSYIKEKDEEEEVRLISLLKIPARD
jgi:hypothetical protein